MDTVQPLLFALMVSIAAVWRAWGIEPGAVTGHSMGESRGRGGFGLPSLEDGAAVICHRSRLMRRTSGQGLMGGGWP